MRDRESREAQGKHSPLAWSPVPCGETSVRLRDGALQGTGEEHRADPDAVRAIEFLDGAKTIAGNDGTVAPEGCVVQQKGCARGLCTTSFINSPRRFALPDL